MRYFIDIAYKGTHYHGWQIQPNAISIQETLNKALEILLRHPVETLGSGRTDTGVHASHQWVHFDSEVEITNYKFLYKINALLPDDIVVNSFYKTSKPELHARFDATTRSYRYVISLTPNPFLKDIATIYYGEPDIVLMNQAAQFLLQYEDLECFSKFSKQQEHHRCKITKAEWSYENELLVFTITGNRFLRGMVRLIVGTLLEVGREKRSVEDIENLILSKDRKKAAAAAPSDGLYLSEVIYPEGSLLRV